MTKEFYLQRLRSAMSDQRRSSAEIEACCGYAEMLLSRGLPVLFDAGHVWKTLRLQEIDLTSYHTFYISQIAKDRRITAPSQPLKQRQKWILREILSKLEVSPYAHGFEAGRSIKTNALLHADHPYVLCVDIQDFFPSISSQAVQRIFQEAGYSPSAAQMLGQLCCYQGVLPQGAPTSPKLSNLFFRKLDRQLAEVADRAGAVYSRYADDLTFSSSIPLRGLLPRVKTCLKAEGFSLNDQKIHFYGPGVPKRITGLTVQNGEVRVPKSFKRALRQEIYYCRRYGVLTHLENVNSRRFIHYREYLYGKAYYVHMIEPEVGTEFLQQLDQIEWPSGLIAFD